MVDSFRVTLCGQLIIIALSTMGYTVETVPMATTQPTREVKLVHPKSDALVTRDNSLIEARYYSTKQEQRVMMWVISEIDPRESEVPVFKVSVRELYEFAGAEKNRNMYQEMIEVTKRLETREVEIWDNERGKYSHQRLIAGAEYDMGQGTVSIAISPFLVPYLVNLKSRFTTIALKYALALRNAYSMRLYDFLKQYQTVGHRDFTLDELRELLGIKDKYPSFRDLRRRVIDPAVSEVSSKTDIQTHYEQFKSGKRVTKLRFHISKSENPPEALYAPDGKEERIYHRLKRAGVREKVAEDLMQQFYEDDPERIAWHIDELERKVSAGQAPKAPAGWLITAIKKDYRPQGSLFKPEPPSPEAKAKAKAARRLKERQALLDLLNREYLATREQEIDEIFAQEAEAWEGQVREQVFPLIGQNMVKFVQGPKWWRHKIVTPHIVRLLEDQGKLVTKKESFFEVKGHSLSELMRELSQ